ncbi:MAG: tol-pal system protein YbgF [Alphaproteobacteria bacterium]|nr:tol-pal system protein YbgF [Alphaproteobacteria bacterium]
MRSPAIVLSSLVFCLLFSVPAFSASDNTKERLQRIEQDMLVLQRQFYGQDAYMINESGGLNATNAPKPSPYIVSTSKLQIQISELEERLRQQTGQIEAIQHQNQGLQEQIKRLAADMDIRFKTLQSMPPVAQPLLPAPAANAVPQAPQPAQSSLANHASTTNLSSVTPVPTSATKPAPAAATPTSPQPPVTGIQPGAQGSATNDPKVTSPEASYNYAFNLLSQNKFQEAQYSFRNFIQDNKNHPLLPNAYYWLGESYYVQKDYSTAAVQFLKGFQEAPKGQKAPDNMLKLGMSLGNAGKKSEACTTFKKLSNDFKDAPETILERGKAEAEKVGC